MHWTMIINGIEITIMKYSNRGILILLGYNEQRFRILATLTDHLRVEIMED